MFANLLEIINMKSLFYESIAKFEEIPSRNFREIVFTSRGRTQGHSDLDLSPQKCNYSLVQVDTCATF